MAWFVPLAKAAVGAAGQAASGSGGNVAAPAPQTTNQTAHFGGARKGLSLEPEPLDLAILAVGGLVFWYVTKRKK